jgi:hypothetical protein
MFNAPVMAHPFGRNLIFDFNCGGARGFEFPDCPGRVYGIAKTNAAVNDKWQRRAKHYPPGGVGNLGQGEKRFADSVSVAKRATAEVPRLETTSLADPRHQRIQA